MNRGVFLTRACRTALAGSADSALERSHRLYIKQETKQ
jgi:hypothetical protein